MITLSEKQAAAWKSRIESANKLIDRHQDDWKQSNSAYAGLPLKDLPDSDVLLPNKDMPRVKQKIAQLFYQVPEIVLSTQRPEYRGAVHQFAAVLNFFLKKRVKADVMMDECLTDLIAVSGLAVSKIGYEATTVDVDVPTVSEQEATLLAQAGQKVPTEKVPVPIHEDYFWKRISPAKALWSSEFTGTDFDDCPWVGFRFRKPWDVAKKQYRIPDEHDAQAPARDEKTVTDSEDTAADRPLKEVECIEIWYKASLFDPTVKNPLLQRRLVFVEGVEKPVVHEDSPYQRFEEDRFLVGMKKYPIRFLSLTTVPDEAVPPSDVKIARPLVRELQEGRTDMMKQRKRSVPLRWYNASGMDPAVVEKIESGEIQDIIPVNGPGDNILGEIARANYPRETFEFQRVVEHDLQEAWSLGSNAVGADSPGEQSATEVNAIQGAMNTRLDYERTKVLRWFLTGSELLGDLLQLFADEPDYIEVTGPDGSRAMEQWDKQTIAGEFLFSAKSNSQLRLDVSQERMDARNAYQLLANEPYANRQALVEHVAAAHGLDPARFLVQPEPQKPTPPNVSFRFSGDDLNPLNPSFDIVAAVLAMGGYAIPQEALDAARLKAATMMATGGMPNMPGPTPQAPADTEHGGPAEQATPISKKQQGDGDYR
jgi:hypothetical protein